MKRKKKALPSLRKTLLTVFIVCIFWFISWATQPFFSTNIPQPGTPIQLYANQIRDDLRQQFMTGIQQAKKSVVLIIYSLTDAKILQALRQKGEEGIDVRVICDAKASPYADKKLGKGITVCKCSHKGIMHQKILVVDGEYVWLGSANMTSESLRMHDNLVLALHSPAVASMILAKADGLQGNSLIQTIPPQDFSIAGQKVELWFLPDNPHGVERLIQLIRSAKKTIRVAMFTWTHQNLAKEIIKAKKRGIDVETAIDYNSGKGTSAKVVRLLSNEGVPVSLSKSYRGLLHHKFVYIDEEILVNGSANWTLAAFARNDDCFVVLHALSSTQTQKMNQLWDSIKKNSTPVKIDPDIVEINPSS